MMSYVDTALRYAGNPGACCLGDPTKLSGAFRLLRGCLLPLVGKIKKRRNPGAEYDPAKNINFAPFEALKPHMAMHPTLMLLRPRDAQLAGGAVRCGCAALLLPVTPQGFNYPADHAQRLRNAGVADAYWDSMCVAMCVHVYDDADYGLWSTFQTKQPNNKPLELDVGKELDPEGGSDPFLYGFYRDRAKIDAIPFGTGKHLQISGIYQAMDMLSIRDGHEVLSALRRDPAAWLDFMGTRELSYVAVWKSHAGRETVRKSEAYEMHRQYPSGQEMRDYMFAERALRKTPLAPLLTGGALDLAGIWPADLALDMPRFWACMRDSL